MTSTIKVDTISENTSANGVSIDGLTIKDGGITATTGAIVFNEASADLDFRVESNGNANMLFVNGGDDKVFVGGTGPTYGQLGVENAGDVQIDLFSNVGSGTEGKAEIFFSTDTSSDHLSVASIVLQQDGAGDRKGEILLNVSDNGGPATAVTVQNNKNVIFGGSIYIGGTGSANLLGDYEEGTWTATLTTTGTAFTTTGNTSTCFYTKVGRLVTLSVSASVTSPSNGSGNLKLTGLPFTSGSHDTVYCNITRPGRIDCTSGDGIFASMFSNSSTITFEKATDNAGSTAIAASDLNGNTTPFLGFNFSYYV